MAEARELHRISLIAPRVLAEAFANALEPFCGAVAWSADETAAEARLSGFSEKPPDAGGLVSALSVAAAALGVEAPEPVIERVPVRDWVVENLKEFPPKSIGRFFVHGADFQDPAPPSMLALRVPAGAAFGSGEHGSTLGCLLALQGLAGKRVGSALDMGCGSGILALAMARLWRAHIVAVDSDPRAVATAARNARGNGLASRVRTVTARGYRSLGGRHFDVIASNILALPLARMSGDLAWHLAPGGVAVLSGFVTKDANRVLVPHRAQGLRLVRRVTADGWMTLVMEKRLRAR